MVPGHSIGFINWSFSGPNAQLGTENMELFGSSLSAYVAAD